MIAYIRTNPVVSDPRAEKEIHSLTAHGLKVTVLGWDRGGSSKRTESFAGRTVLRLRLPAPYGRPIMVAYYPIFWLWVLSRLLAIRPKVIHACDLDSVFPALLYRVLYNGTQVIFDIYDSYALWVKMRSRVLGGIVLCLERFAVGASDALIVVSEGQLNLYKGSKLKRFEIVKNYPDLNSTQDNSFENCFKKSGTAFRIVYAGVIAPYRGLKEIVEATATIDGVEFLVAGRIIDRKLFEWINSFPHVKYLGELKFERSLALEHSADLIPVLYDLSSPKYGFLGLSPNKLYEAMMLGVPVITNVSSSVQGESFGVSVDYHRMSDIREGILHMKRSPHERRRLGQNGRLVFKRVCDWAFMEKRLLALYQSLLCQT